ncbi:hypothetical protein K492DRAFT_170301 [Lichtheimia hyalospora FSU 10163]|nr:hypothetical protein K492DRAFT_170301 [Lichtheimia hyalospora FSU 10163]
MRLAVIVNYHINASESSYQELMSLIANIFVYALWSRPGLFAPTLFVMHDASLTPTRKVA